MTMTTPKRHSPAGSDGDAQGERARERERQGESEPASTSAAQRNVSKKSGVWDGTCWIHADFSSAAHEC